MTINTTLIIILAIFFYLIYPFFIMLIKNKKIQKALAIVSLCIFIAILTIGTLGKIDISKEKTIISFEKSGTWANKTISFSFSNLILQDIIINILMLLPIGFFVSYIFENKKWWEKILLSTAIGLCCGILIEFCQFIFPVPRSVQLSDAILNMISSTLGSILYLFYRFVIKKIYEKQNK